MDPYDSFNSYNQVPIHPLDSLANIAPEDLTSPLSVSLGPLMEPEMGISAAGQLESPEAFGISPLVREELLNEQLGDNLQAQVLANELGLGQGDFIDDYIAQDAGLLRSPSLGPFEAPDIGFIEQFPLDSQLPLMGNEPVFTGLLDPIGMKDSAIIPEPFQDLRDLQPEGELPGPLIPMNEEQGMEDVDTMRWRQLARARGLNEDRYIRNRLTARLKRQNKAAEKRQDRERRGVWRVKKNGVLHGPYLPEEMEASHNSRVNDRLILNRAFDNSAIVGDADEMIPGPGPSFFPQDDGFMFPCPGCGQLFLRGNLEIHLQTTPCGFIQ